MNSKFYEWAKSVEDKLKKIGILCEIPDFTKENIEKCLESPCQTVYFGSEEFYGKVCVWESGQMDTEILNTETEEILEYKYYEKIEINTNFDELLSDFLSKMVPK